MEIDPRREGMCPACRGTDLRLKFANTPKPLCWCPDCMIGMGLPDGPVVDMRLFQSAIDMREEIMKERSKS